MAQQREIAAEGGRAAHASGNAHEFTSEEARAAGRMSHNDDKRQSGGNASGSSGSSGGNKQEGSGRSGSDGGGSGGGSGGNEGSSGGVQGGTREQHAEAGRQSHKNN